MDLKNEFKGTIADDMLELFDRPDDEFAMLAPFIKAKLKQGFESKEYQDQLLTLVEMYDSDSVEQESLVIDELIENIKIEPDLSAEKKDVLVYLFELQKEAFVRVKECGRTRITVKFTKLSENAITPTYAHPRDDAGCDLYAAETVEIKPGETKIVKTDIAAAVPIGYELQIRPRSGMSAKTSIRIANAPGTVDAGYRGNIGVICENQLTDVWGGTNETYTIHKGDKIAQAVLNEVPLINWEEVPTVEDLGSSERGEGGFGSTGQ
jgi:dUTP pyrophosphatase